MLTVKLGDYIKIYDSLLDFETLDDLLDFTNNQCSCLSINKYWFVEGLYWYTNKRNLIGECNSEKQQKVSKLNKLLTLETVKYLETNTIGDSTSDVIYTVLAYTEDYTKDIQKLAHTLTKYRSSLVTTEGLIEYMNAGLDPIGYISNSSILLEIECRIEVGNSKLSVKEIAIFFSVALLIIGLFSAVFIQDVYTSKTAGVKQASDELKGNHEPSIDLYSVLKDKTRFKELLTTDNTVQELKVVSEDKAKIKMLSNYYKVSEDYMLKSIQEILVEEK